MKAQPDVDSNSADAPFDRKAVLGDALRRRILSMELAPGAVVDELALCDEFGLSRPPVRELLRQIAAEGYIELEANRAPRVAAMSHDSLHAFFLAAPLIYIATTQLAATHASEAEIETLKAIQEDFRKAIEEHQTANEFDAQATGLPTPFQVEDVGDQGPAVATDGPGQTLAEDVLADYLGRDAQR